MADFEDHGNVDTHKGNAKDLFRLIAHSPPLLAAALVGLVLLIYFLAKKGPSAGGTTGTSAAAGTATPLQVVGLRPQFIVNSPATALPTPVAPTAPTTSTPAPVVPTAPPIVAPPPTMTVPHTDYAIIRTRGSNPGVAAYDAKFTGVPVRSSAASGSDQIGTIAFGSQVQITGPAVQGTSNFVPGKANGTGTGTDYWYPVTYNGNTAYVSAFDVSSGYQQ